MPRPISGSAVLLLAALTCGACRGPVEPTASDLQPGHDLASGPQRIEWDQPALEGTDVASYQFVLQVDGVETELAAACGELTPSGTHLCSAELPDLSAGRHVLTLAAVHEKDGKRFASRRSVSLAIDTR